MGMYSLIEDDNNKRMEALIASGMSEDDAIETMREEDDAAESRLEGMAREALPMAFGTKSVLPKAAP